MAINNFQSLVIDEDGDLRLEGVNIELDADGNEIAATFPRTTRIAVTVIACDPDDDRRCGPVVSSPSSSTWPAVASASDHEFVPGDDVYVIGETDHPLADGLFVWCNRFHIGDPAPVA